MRRLDTIFNKQKYELDAFNKAALPRLESSISAVASAKDNIIHANTSIEKAITDIKKSRSKKWIYIGIGFLIGGSTISLIK